MSVLDGASLLLGLVVLLGVAVLASPLRAQSDSDMVWEGRVAVGFGALIYVQPFWLAQGILALIATLKDGGLSPWWLWAWFVVAPVLGALPPAAAAGRALRRALPWGRPATYSNRSAAAVQQGANFAWAATEAESGWQLGRTPPLPASWPPPEGGPAVWLCYAERPSSAGIEVTAPWARITLANGPSEWPVTERLADAVEAFGAQEVSVDGARKAPLQGALIDAVHRGDPEGLLAKVLQDWQIRNPAIAGHPGVAAHLPPV